MNSRLGTIVASKQTIYYSLTSFVTSSEKLLMLPQVLRTDSDILLSRGNKKSNI